MPIVSGNVSLYNETEGEAILPTPVIGGVGVLADQAKDRLPGFWFGTKVEFTDGGMCSLLLLLLIVWAAFGWEKRSA